MSDLYSDLCSDDENYWFVIHTHVRQEYRAEANLRTHHVETFTPRVKEYSYNPYTSVPTVTIKPFFPRYIFARFTTNNLIHMVNFTRGVHSVVSFGGKPATVSDEVIKVIQSRIGEDGLVQMQDELKPGDEVMIKEGPLKDFVGVFERTKKGSDRVVILLNTVFYQPLLEIRRHQIRRIG